MRLAAIRKDPLARRDIGATTAPGRPAPVRHGLIVTPESLPAWIRGVESAKSLLVDRGMTTRPEYATQDIAYVKIVPDSGDNLLITGDIMLPDALIMTMQRRPELPDPFGLGGWRAHSLGGPSPVDQMPGPAASH